MLRSNQNPKHNIRTYAGISASRLEQMEERLKDDVLAEARTCSGLILVHDELGNIFNNQKKLMKMNLFS